MSDNKNINNGFREALAYLGSADDNVVLIADDSAGHDFIRYFSEKLQERFFCLGHADKSLPGIAAGFSLTSKIPFIITGANNASTRFLEQLNGIICRTNLNVKIGAVDPGHFSSAGSTEENVLDDISIIRMLPDIKIVIPCDYHEAIKSAKSAYEEDGPFYIRLENNSNERLTGPESKFEVGKGITLQHGNDITIVANGISVLPSVRAADMLKNDGINTRLINLHTVMPVDEELLISATKETGKFVVVEQRRNNNCLFHIVGDLVCGYGSVTVESTQLDITSSAEDQNDSKIVSEEWIQIIYESVKKTLKT